MNVLLLDDHPLILMALTEVLKSLEAQITVVASDTPQAAFDALAGGPAFDLALVDLNLGEQIDGFGVLGQIRERHPDTPVVVVSATDRLGDVVRAVDMGAMGFVPKRSSIEQLRQALSMVLAGGVYIPAELLSLIMRMQGQGELGDTTIGGARAQAARDAAVQPPASSPAMLLPGVNLPVGPLGAMRAQRADGLDLIGLTPRQTEVLALLLRALPNKLIARELQVSVETVKDHVAAVLRALGVSNRTQAVLAVGQVMQQRLASAAPPG